MSFPKKLSFLFALLTMGIGVQIMISCSSSGSGSSDEDSNQVTSSSSNNSSQPPLSSGSVLSSSSGNNSSPSGATSSSSVPIVETYCQIQIYCLELPDSWCSKYGTKKESCQSITKGDALCCVGKLCYSKKIPEDLCLDVLNGTSTPDKEPECAFDPTTEFCYNGTAHKKCGGKSYKPDTEKCVGGWVISNSVNCPASVPSGSFCDARDAQIYKQVTIGSQTWMAENLNFSSTNIGRCYQDDTKNCDTYGRLYDWNDAAKVCPEGWHLPTQSEWTTLVDFAGGAATAGAKLKATSGWDENGNGASEGNLDFNALPGGLYNSSWQNKGRAANFWSADALNTSYFGRYMGSWDSKVEIHNDPKSSLQAVRCMKN